MQDKPVGGVIIYVLKPSVDGFRVLFLRRTGGLHEGSWWPVAGTPKPGEAPADTAQRELLEETSLRPREMLEFDLEIPHVDPEKRLVTYVVLVSDDAEIRLNEEHSAYRWLTGEEAILAVPTHSQVYLEHLNDHFINALQAGSLGRF